MISLIEKSYYNQSFSNLITSQLPGRSVSALLFLSPPLKLPPQYLNFGHNIEYRAITGIDMMFDLGISWLTGFE
jgi:hypothetical protein